ncbi:uncharacterized protein LOC112087890 [Eutrema salsugineum]|uniref:uncharacterized protein LOC112087890 n=1 Tax=Eutrema salsugineum TaxID=72664 RepID=UPI000CED1653|nr:uncharacterized protein LOC112087890 [Eutrema salsugineum]
MTSLKSDLVKAYLDEESFWQQKCRDKWLSNGDRNTKFFHASVKASRSRNGLEILMDGNGILQRAEASKGDVAVKYFSDLFKSSHPKDFHDTFKDFKPRVSDSINNLLIQDVSKEDVKNATFSIKSDSAPGADVSLEIMDFFRKGFFPREWNFTQICLIPKKVGSPLMTDLRPISLCSVMYKIISKIIASRLKPHLPLIVSPNQSAFVSERLISDNIMIAHEAVHALRTHPKISKEFMAMKTDMSKAYDRVEWRFLADLLKALGFHRKWIDWVMFCVKSVSYSVLINGQTHGLIIPERGLRQGDPLSPFLFVLCTEGLTHLLNKAEREGLINGIQFSDSGPAVHHLLFADDSLFMCKIEESQCATIQSILKEYGEATGQVINRDKSSLTFGDHVEESLKTMVKEKFGIHNEGGAGKYLGLPECFSGSKREMLAYIQDNFKNRMSNWYSRLLSQGGKEVLIKFVAMSMPVYAMTCFKLPKYTCEKLTFAMADFWWGTEQNKRSIHWISWEKMCIPKDQGGLGFRKIEDFNQALLAKQAWRLLQDPECLFSQVMRSRYYDNDNILDAEIGTRPSFGWRSILFGRDLLERGLRLMVGNGASIRVWTDLWIEDGDYRAPLRKNSLVDLELKVEDLIDHRRKWWDRDKLEEHFLQRDIDLIIKIKPILSSPDFWCWKAERSGEYSVKSGFCLASKVNASVVREEMLRQPSFDEIKKQIWSSLCPAKIKTFMWKVISGAIPVVDNFISRGMKMDTRCQICGLEGESANHVLFSCTRARQVWASSQFPTPKDGFHENSVFQNIFYLLMSWKNKDIPLEIRRLYPWILWLLWKNRNSFLFEAKNCSAIDTMDKIRDDTNQWFLAQEIERVDQELDRNGATLRAKKWLHPPISCRKCNIGHSWDKSNSIGGAAWILRNDKGVVLLHSRCSFSPIRSLNDAKLASWIWAVESMSSLHQSNIIFASEASELIGALSRPNAWPSFKFQALEISKVLSKISDWKAVYESPSTNKGASLIAKSVTNEDRRQSYVALGYPFWMQNTFIEEGDTVVL